MSMLASISGLPAFLLYFGTALGLVAAYLVVYGLATAHDELQLVRRNVAAAALARGRFQRGFALPLASAILNAQNILDCIVWGLVALIVQVLVYWLVRAVLPDLSERIANDETAAALLLGAASLAAGVLNAASMTY
jgi:putative membrane protein